MLDQSGISRPQGSAVDIGPFEFSFFSPFTFKGGILFYRYEGLICPSPQVIWQSPTNFLVRLTQTTEPCGDPERRGTWTLVLGQVAPGSEVIVAHEELGQPLPCKWCKCQS